MRPSSNDPPVASAHCNHKCNGHPEQRVPGCGLFQDSPSRQLKGTRRAFSRRGVGRVRNEAFLNSPCPFCPCRIGVSGSMESKNFKIFNGPCWEGARNRCKFLEGPLGLGVPAPGSNFDPTRQPRCLGRSRAWRNQDSRTIGYTQANLGPDLPYNSLS